MGKVLKRSKNIEIGKEVDRSLIYEDLAKIFGPSYIKAPIRSEFDFIVAARNGVKMSIIQKFKNHFGIEVDTVATLLNTSPSTLNRWSKMPTNPLDEEKAVKVFELSELFLHGISVFGSNDAFFAWMGTPNISLGGECPIDLIQFSSGVSMVKDVLIRIEYGVFA